MMRLAAVLALGALIGMVAAGVRAQQTAFSGLARVDMARTRIDDRRDGARLRLGLSQGVPWRVFTLADPPRLVLDFREVDWRGVEPDLLDWSDAVRTVRVGGFRPGWSRMVVDLAGPFAVETANAVTDDASGQTDLDVVLKKTSLEAFAATAGAPDSPGWRPRPEGLPSVARARQRGEGKLLVVLDAGHGGIDPGAERDGQTEKALMLRFARELREVLLCAGDFDVALTRDADAFVSLERRVAIAHELGADVFMSLHADALSKGRAHGATIYTLSESASDEASAALAERHNRANMLAGVDLTDSDDVIAEVLMDLARLETQPRAERLAEAIRLGIAGQKLPLHSRPLRAAGFSVLKAPDVPSVLIELGFLSSPRDRANLVDPDWRGRMAGAIRDALLAWRVADAASAELVRH